VCICVCVSQIEPQKEQAQGTDTRLNPTVMYNNIYIYTHTYVCVCVRVCVSQIEETDLRKNGRGALTLVCSKSKVQKEIEHRQLPFFDIETYNHEFEETGHVELVGVCPGV